MGYHFDYDAIRWIPKDQPLSRPLRQVHRNILLRGLAEEVVYESSLAQLYASLLAAVICDGNGIARRDYENWLSKARSAMSSVRV